MQHHHRFLAGILTAFLAIAAFGCANDPIISEYMIIVPDTLVLSPPTQDTTISITHSCSCPFTWSATITPAADTSWLSFPTYQRGDKTDIPISINRARLSMDTSWATIHLTSNSYGDTSIVIAAIR